MARPLKFQSVEELEDKINDFFTTVPFEEWTITGLALHLDCETETIKNYGERDGFSDSVKKAYLKVQNSYERDLKKYGRSGTIFGLKNFGWKDENFVNQDTTIKINAMNYGDTSSNTPIPPSLAASASLLGSTGSGNQEISSSLAPKSEEDSNTLERYDPQSYPA
jgi:hypothetical protein